jgi:hypothetical protein
MRCDTCKGEELTVIKVARYSKPLVAAGYVLWILAVLAAIGAGVYMTRSDAAAEDPGARAVQNAVTKLEQINAVTPEMIKDFQDDGLISETSLSKLGSEDRTEVDKVLSDFRTGALTGTASGQPVWVFWGMVFVVCGAVFIVGLAITLRKEKLKCAKCGALIELDEG